MHGAMFGGWLLGIGSAMLLLFAVYFIWEAIGILKNVTASRKDNAWGAWLIVLSVVLLSGSAVVPVAIASGIITK